MTMQIPHVGKFSNKTFGNFVVKYLVREKEPAIASDSAFVDHVPESSRASVFFVPVWLDDRAHRNAHGRPGFWRNVQGAAIRGGHAMPKTGHDNGLRRVVSKRLGKLRPLFRHALMLSLQSFNHRLAVFPAGELIEDDAPVHVPMLRRTHDDALLGVHGMRRQVSRVKRTVPYHQRRNNRPLECKTNGARFFEQNTAVGSPGIQVLRIELRSDLVDPQILNLDSFDPMEAIVVDRFPGGSIDPNLFESANEVPHDHLWLLRPVSLYGVHEPILSRPAGTGLLG